MIALSAPFFIFCCWKWGDWKNWKVYYPTILYVILVDFLTNFLTAHYPLWEFNYKIVNHTLSDIFIAFTVFPSTVILFLSHYPRKPIRQAFHILLWAGLYILLEALCTWQGLFLAQNGWNLWWSSGFDVMMFVMIRLHYQKPLLAWPISAALITVALYILKLPIGTMR